MNSAVNESVFDSWKTCSSFAVPRNLNDEERREWLEFVMKFQQITGPVMAKGLEDTAFYVYNRLISLNEVEGRRTGSGTPVEEFHNTNLRRQKSWPHAMIATSTHDSKRGEDVRARISVLSEIRGSGENGSLRGAASTKRNARPSTTATRRTRTKSISSTRTLVGPGRSGAGTHRTIPSTSGGSRTIC